MNKNDRLFTYVKRWQGLEASRKDLDHAYCEFARELRAEFSTDREFVAWCATELGLTESQSCELLARAEVAKLVTTPKDFEDLGGWRACKRLDELPTKAKRAAAVTTARATGKTVGTVVREMIKAEQPAKPAEPERDPRVDVRTLARYIAETLGGSERSDIRALVDHYTGRRSSAPAVRRKVA